MNNIIIGGIVGLVKTISFTGKEPSIELRERMEGIPAEDICVHDFNCALDGTI